MPSLYEVLGAHANDDAHAIKKAFRAAVKAYHPDLHPDDPEAVLRFRRIVTANAILRDAKRRAAYDELLAKERRQIKVRQVLRLQYRRRRRRTRLKLGAAAAVVAVCALAGVYGLFMSMPTTIVVDVMTGKPAAKPTTETFKKDKVASASVVAAQIVTAGRSNDAAAAGGADKSTGSIGAPPAGQEGSDAQPVRAAGVQAGVVAAPAGAGAADGQQRPDPADNGDVFTIGGDPPPPPHDAHFYRELGVALYRIGDFPRAIVNLDEAIRLDPADALAHNIRGNALDEIGAFDSALADYNEAIRLDPNNPGLFHDRAIMWHRKGDLDKALVDLDHAIRFTFSDPNLYCDRGLIWYEKGSHARAIADFNNAIKLDPDVSAACISRGLILHRSAEFNVAFADMEKTIRVSPAVFDVSRRVASHP